MTSPFGIYIREDSYMVTSLRELNTEKVKDQKDPFLQNQTTEDVYGPKEGAVKTSHAEAANQPRSHPLWLPRRVVRRWIICDPGDDGWLLLCTFPESPPLGTCTGTGAPAPAAGTMTWLLFSFFCNQTSLNPHNRIKIQCVSHS